MALTKVEAEQLQAAQPNITSVGTLTGLTTSGLVTIDGSGAFLQVDVGGTLAARVGSSNDIVGGTDNDAIFQTRTGADMRFYSGSSESMRIDSNGNVGIGVTPSTLWSSSYEALQIGLGASIAAHNAAGNAMKIGSNMVYEGTAPNYYDKYLTSATAAKYELDVHGHKWYYAASGTAGNAISWNEAMRINSSGNVGIGITNPETKLHISGGDPSIRLQAGASADARVDFEDSGGTVRWYSGYDVSSGNLVLGADETGFGGSNIIVMNDSGNVGIGESVPDRRLHVKSGANSTDGAFRIESANNNIMDMGTDGTGHFLNCVNADPFRVKFAGTEKFRIHNGGNVTITDGDLVIGTSGHGIDFSAAAGVGAVSGSPPGVNTDSSLLDDYEEGTFAANIRGQTTAGAFNYTLQQGRYTKIGRAVNITMTIYFASRTQAPAGNIQILLPFTANSQNTQHAFYVGWAQNITFNGTQLGAYLGGNSNILYLRSIASGGAGGVVQGSDTSNLLYLIVSGTYYV